MNWYKISQDQHMLFNPWQRGHDNITEKINPSRQLEDGTDVYQCQSCGKEVMENDVAKWYLPQDSKTRNYIPPDYTTDQIRNVFFPLSELLKPYLNEFNKWVNESSEFRSPYSWEMQAPDVLEYVRNNQFMLSEVCSRILSFHRNSPPCSLLNFNGEFNGDDLKNLSSFVENPENSVNEFINKMTDSITTSVTVPLCEECLGDLKTCDSCSEPIAEDTQWFESTWGTEICEECIEGGSYSICTQCGKADSQEDMHYVEDDGDYCDECYKGLEGESVEWAQGVLSNLDIPIGKNLPVKRKALENVNNFLGMYSQKFDTDSSLTEDEVGKLLHVAKKSGLNEAAMQYLDHLVKSKKTVEEVGEAVDGNIEAQDHMKSLYPNLKNFEDLPVDVEVTSNYLQEIPGFTITITPNDEFFEWAEKKNPGAKAAWNIISDTPHHPRTLAYVRCAYDGGDEIVINNLQRDADLDNFREKVKHHPGLSGMVDQRLEQSAIWLNQVTKHWDTFLIHLISSMAKSEDKKAYLTSAEMQEDKWSRTPEFKNRRTYNDVPQAMGFDEGEEPISSLIERGVSGHMWQVAQNMNWYKKAQMSGETSGEFWITDGQALDASENGDYNHESYVIERVSAEVGEHFNLYSDMPDWSEIESAALKEILDSSDEQSRPQIQQKFEDDPDTVIIDYLKNAGVENAYDLVEIAHGGGDARNYAIVRWGWKRLEGNNIETWTITPGDMQDIANGLWDAYQEGALKSTFNINVYANRKWYSDVPYEVIENEKIMELRQYDSLAV